jgi:peptide alpha-N-acetyltransferase
MYVWLAASNLSPIAILVESAANLPGSCCGFHYCRGAPTLCRARHDALCARTAMKSGTDGDAGGGAAATAATVTTATITAARTDGDEPELVYSIFSAVAELDAIRALIDQELSEPYSVYTYRHFVYNWPQLCIMCREKPTGALVGIIICKAEAHKSGKKRGYIAMLVVDKPSRKRGIGAELVSRALHTMAELGCDEAALETELTNSGALRLCVHYPVDRHFGPRSRRRGCRQAGLRERASECGSGRSGGGGASTPHNFLWPLCRESYKQPQVL